MFAIRNGPYGLGPTWKSGYHVAGWPGVGTQYKPIHLIGLLKILEFKKKGEKDV